MTIWAIEDSTGQVLLDLACASRDEVGRRIVPVHFDAFRLQVSSSYREVFDRAVKQVLQREGWQIVRVNQRKTVAGTITNRQRVATGARWPDGGPIGGNLTIATEVGLHCRFAADQCPWRA